MKKESKLVLGLKKGKDFSKIERTKIIQEYLSTGQSKKEVWQKYTGQTSESGQLLRWMRQLGYLSLSTDSKPQGVFQKQPSSYTNEEKRLIIEEYLASGSSKRDIWGKYTGQLEEHGSILRWMRQLGYPTAKVERRSNFTGMKRETTLDRSEEKFENLQLRKRIQELENQLKDAEMKAIAFSTMVDVAEKEFNIRIRKKFNTKPLK